MIFRIHSTTIQTSIRSMPVRPRSTRTSSLTHSKTFLVKTFLLEPEKNLITCQQTSSRSFSMLKKKWVKFLHVLMLATNFLCKVAKLYWTTVGKNSATISFSILINAQHFVGERARVSISSRGRAGCVWCQFPESPTRLQKQFRRQKRFERFDDGLLPHWHITHRILFWSVIVRQQHSEVPTKFRIWDDLEPRKTANCCRGAFQRRR